MGFVLQRKQARFSQCSLSKCIDGNTTKDTGQAYMTLYVFESMGDIQFSKNLKIALKATSFSYINKMNIFKLASCRENSLP